MANDKNTNKEVILKVENLSQHFKINKAVDNVSFDVYKGEVFGIVGESGCGKTTIGRTIIKLYNATDGNVYLKGRRIVAGTLSLRNALKEAKVAGDSAKVAEIKNKIAKAKYDQKYCDKNYMTETGTKEKLVTKIQMIFQDPIASLNPRMTVREIIAEGLVIRGEKDKKYINDKVYEMLELIGLVREHADRYPHEFSGGQRQRIGIARAIILNPDILIADEPISALDVSIQAQVINLLNELRDKMNLTIMFIAHDLSVVKYFSDRIAVMYFGKMVELSTSKDLFAHPLHPYTRALLSAIPVPDPNIEKHRTRILYNPKTDHNYETDKPSLREVNPGHFVLCNDEEEKRYKQEIANSGN
jgi:ABC-type oligopeptide transport system ATPase subunit